MSGWSDILDPIWEKHRACIEKSLQEEETKFCDVLEIFPPKPQIFRAFNLCPFQNLHVVIVGMDPYIRKHEAHGLAFSVAQGKTPPSLRNIFKELERCYGKTRTNTNLTDWAEQGVLLLNTALTVREGCSGSHVGIWKDFTQDLMAKLGSTSKHCVFMLWGKHAQAFEHLIHPEDNLVLKHSHPSPLARKPFVGNNHFVKCNDYLVHHGKPPIHWVE